MPRHVLAEAPPQRSCPSDHTDTAADIITHLLAYQKVSPAGREADVDRQLARVTGRAAGEGRPAARGVS